MTNSEKRYIEGRKILPMETIVIGSDSENPDRSDVLISGKMVAGETGEPLIGATIYVHELNEGAVSEPDGHYTIVLPPGEYVVDFSCMGMETERYLLDIRSEGNLDISMDPSLIPISEVVIEGRRFHNVKGTQMGFGRLSSKTIREIPVMLGEKDLLKITQLLPGIQNVGEGVSGFNVRGSAADQNMIYVNKVPLYNSSHLFGFFSILNPDIVNELIMYKSNVPAKYGGRLASFTDISTRQGNMKNHTARGGISPVTGHFVVEGPLAASRSAFVLSARSTYSDWILRRLPDPDLRKSDASFYDLAGTLTSKAGEKTLLKTFGYFSRDRFLLGSTNSYRYSNSGASVNLGHHFNPRVSGELAAVYGGYTHQTTDHTLASFAYRHRYRIKHYELKGDVNWLTLGLTGSVSAVMQSFTNWTGDRWNHSASFP